MPSTSSQQPSEYSDLTSTIRAASSGDIHTTTDTSRKTSAPTSLFSLPQTPPSTRFLNNFKLGRTTTPTSAGISPPPTDEIGLHLIQDVQKPVADLILVHGLGGSWMKTWSWNRDPQYFWPAWLPLEDDLSRLRIFSFGYNANFTGRSSTLGILDFAKDLLRKMAGWSSNLDRIGQVPIIFVAHSMGGLVVKKAYVLGTMDDSYAEMISRIFGIIFLATPHRGSDYARTLNNILAISMFWSAKVYVAELVSMSPTLRDINEHFRLVCKSLQLVSFYETQKTSVAGTKKLIVDYDSGVLGYPSETAMAINADHHNVCKFRSRASPDYVSLRDTIRGWVSKITSLQESPAQTSVPGKDFHNPNPTEILSKLTKILGINETVDLAKYQEAEGTCCWFHLRPEYTSWLDASGSPGTAGVLWLTGLPGAGKSTLAQSVVASFNTEGEDINTRCQYHFFSFSDATKRKVAYALRSIAFQLALANEAFCQQLLQLHDKSGLHLDQHEMQVIWSRIFEGIIFKMEFAHPLYWVFDGLDEADNPVPLVNSIFKCRPKSPVRVFFASRPSRILLGLAAAPRPSLTHVELTMRDTEDDIQLLIRTRLQETLPISKDVKERVAEKMIAKASGSFLWAKLALNTLEQAWYTEEDLQRALNDIPKGMQALFQRMRGTIEALREENPRNYALARRILTWATCSAEPLTTDQLAVVLEPEFTKLQNLEVIILHLCGHFISTTNSKIMPIHETAETFLLDATESQAPFLDGPTCHEHLAKVCITYLGGEAWKSVLLRIQGGDSHSELVFQNRLQLFLAENPFLTYAVSHWAYHVSHADSESDELFANLHDFFDRHILSWIHACVLLGGLRLITRAAQHIKVYGRKRKSQPLLGSAKSLSRDDADFFQLWAADLLRVVGRFGGNLMEKPASIYKVVPPLCPRGSMMFKTYSSGSPLSLQGISSVTWDDCLARLPIGGERSLSRILTTTTYFICLISVGGEVIVCHSETCEEARRMIHGEYVLHMAVNKSESLLATAGYETFRVWDLSSGAGLYRFPRPGTALVLTITFGAADTQLVVGYNDCMVICHDVERQEDLWSFTPEDDDEDYHPCPRTMVFGPDITKLAIALPGRPVLIWDITSRETRPVLCVREGDLSKHSEGAWTQLESIIWHPDGLSVFVLYQDTALVRFFLTDEQAVENVSTAAKEMAISQDGNLLLTSDYAGTLSLWSLPNFHLVYRLPYEELVRDLTFSPDSRRFYDIRGALCNVWEPDILLRPDDDEPEDIMSVSGGNETSISGPVLSTDASVRTQITSIAYGPLETYCVCGKDNGSVGIYSILDGQRVRKLYNHASSAAVITLAWSPTGKYVASSDDHGRVVAKRLDSKGEGKWAVFPCFDFRNNEPARQFTFHQAEKLALISFPTSDSMWNLKTKSQIWRRDREQNLGLRWVNHPFDADVLLCIEPTKTSVYSWSHPADEATSASVTESRPPSPSRHSTVEMPTQVPDPRVRRVATSEIRQHIIIEVLPGIGAHTESAGKKLHLDIIQAEDLQKSGSRNKAVVRRVLKQISSHVRYFLGCYKDSIVFLNHEYWVCTWPLGVPSATPRRHFFLPRDSIGPSMLPHVTLADGGAVLFPRNGELAIVRNGLRL